MGFSFPLAETPFLWVLASGLFTGAALSRALRPIRSVRRAAWVDETVPAGKTAASGQGGAPPGGRAEQRAWRALEEMRRTAKWIFFTLYLSLAVVMALGAVFVPGPARILDTRLVYFYAASTGLFFLVFRFRKVMAPIVVVLLVALIGAVLLFAQALNAFTGETEIGRVRVLAAADGQMTLEVTREATEPVVVPMRGSYFAPVVKVVIFQDYFVFLGAKSWYRFEGISSFEIEQREAGRALRQQDTDHYFPSPSGISERLWRFYERHEGLLPGVRSVQIEMDLKRPREFALYSLLIQNDGGLQIVERR